TGAGPSARTLPRSGDPEESGRSFCTRYRGAHGHFRKHRQSPSHTRHDRARPIALWRNGGRGRRPVTVAEIRERAAEWLLKRHEQDWSQDNQRALDAWLAESPAHRIAYLRLETAWGTADRL